MKTHILALLIIPLLLAGLAACDSGVPQQELDAVNIQLQDEKAKTADLESRLKQVEDLEARLERAAHLEAARGLLADGWELPGPEVLAFLAAAQASDDPELKAGLAELLQGFISSLESLPPQLLGEALAAVQGAGDLDVADAVQALLFAVAQGGGGPELLEVARAAHAANSEPLEQAISGILAEVLGEQGATDLVQSIGELASASTDAAVQQSLQQLREPPEDFLQQVEKHLDAAGVPSLQDGFQQAYITPGGDPKAFYDSVVEQLRQVLGLPAMELST